MRCKASAVSLHYAAPIPIDIVCALSPMSESDLPTLRLKPREDHRLRAGHSWVFSNEVDSAETPLRGFESGQPVAIAASTGKIIGTGYVNPQSLIAARLVSRDHQHPFSASLLVHRLKVALALRDRLFDGPYYRLAYGESDGLPGLVVDRYGALLAVQVTTAGMERMKDEIVDALHKVVAPEVIVFRNDSAVRELEGLDRYVEAAYGRAPDTATVVERGARFDVPFSAGQKTGWFSTSTRIAGAWRATSAIGPCSTYTATWARGVFRRHCTERPG